VRPTQGLTPRQQQVRDAALELFSALGYNATTIDEIGRLSGIRGPSVYRHVRSKQDILVGIMTASMDNLLALQDEALASSEEPVEQLRAFVRAHVRYKAAHRREAYVGTHEIRALEGENRVLIAGQRREYESNLRRLLERGVRLGVFVVPNPRLTSYAILDMGVGVAVWFNESGETSADSVADYYAALALRMVGARTD
jgi:AcrR family transcriptional regulator